MKKVKDKTNAVTCEDYRDAIMKNIEEIHDPNLLKRICEYSAHNQLDEFVKRAMALSRPRRILLIVYLIWLKLCRCRRKSE